MTARIILLFFCSFIGTKCIAQQKAVDSLLNLLGEHPRKDTIRLNLLNDLSYWYTGTDPDKGILIANEAIGLARDLHTNTKLATAYYYKALNHAGKGEDSIALFCYQTAYTLYKESSDSIRMGNTLHNMGIVHFGQSQHDKALELHRQALAIYEKARNQAKVAAAYNSIGINYMYLSDYPRTLEYYLKALSIFETSGEHTGMANALTNIGIVYKNLSKYATALDYHTRALDLYTQSGNRQGMANALGNMGVVYDLQQEQTRAIDCYQQALKISEEIGNQRSIASHLTNMGIIYSDRADYARAWDHFQRSVDIYTETASANNKGIVLNYMGQLVRKAPDEFLRSKGIQPQQRYTKATDYHRQSLQLAAASGTLLTQATAWQHLQETYEAQKDFQQSLLAHKHYISLRDSIFNEQKTEEITRKQMQFEFEKKETSLKAEHEKQQLLAAEEVKRQRLKQQAVMGGGAILLAAAITSFLFYKRKRDADERAKVAEFEAQVSDTEMKALRAQMNPHFIFNSLNSISDFIARHDTKTADYYLSKFAKVMRLILENSEKKEVSLAEDLQALELYIQLECMRLNNKFTYQIRVDESIDTEITLVPPLLLQPFVENSIWHGIAKLPGEGKIMIYIRKEGAMIHCSVEDNGIGRGKKEIAALTPDVTHKKMGMKITSARIAILNTLKQSKADVQISDLEIGTKVEVKLPLALAF